MLSLKNITKIYSRKQSDEDVIALDNVSLDLPDKGFVAILGASGSGKTTLLNIIGGLDKATSGNLIVDGLSTNDFSTKEWDSYRNQKIGFVLQNCYLLPHLNVRDNVAIKLQISHGKKDDIDALVDEALKRVDLLDKKRDKPKALSGGQKQRVAIARALVGNPTVILADEPTGALDSKTGTSIMELLKEASKDHLVVMVTHNNEYASHYADRVIELKDGKVVNDSNPIVNEIIANPSKLDRVSISPKITLKWGFKNLLIKKFSTLSIIVAAALGLTGVGLILSISTGVQHAFNEVEASSFSKYPVQFTSYTTSSPQGTEGQFIPYTDEQNIIVDYSSYSQQQHYNFMSDRFLDYMHEMPKDLYFGLYEVSYTVFNVYTQRKENSYYKVPSTNGLFYKGVDNIDFISDQYDCLKGKYPQEPNELAIVVDKYNRIDVGYLYTLGFDVNTSEITDAKFSFDEVLAKTYKYVSNDDYYVYNQSQGKYVATSKSAKQMYEESEVELRITGILRPTKDNNSPVLNNGVIYTPEFEKFVITDSKNSEIVKAQYEYGLTKNVTTGSPFVDSATRTKESLYEEQLYKIGAFERVTTMNYFTKTYANREKIKNYFETYQADTGVDYNKVVANAKIQVQGKLKHIVENEADSFRMVDGKVTSVQGYDGGFNPQTVGIEDVTFEEALAIAKALPEGSSTTVEYRFDAVVKQITTKWDSKKKHMSFTMYGEGDNSTNPETMLAYEIEMNDGIDVNPVRAYDYLENASDQFDGALKLMTSVLYTFAIVSVLVSAILNAILTFISIRQRTNEIGLLRSLGARRTDIAVMVETESLICGLFGGIASILFSMIIIGPVNKMLIEAIHQYKFYLLHTTDFTLEGFQWWVAPIVIGLGLATALVSALIPSIIASRKDPAKAINE